MGEASSVPQLVRDHPLAVLRTRPEPLQGALVDLDVVVEVAVGVDFPVVVTGLVTWPAAAVNRHVRGVCTSSVAAAVAAIIRRAATKSVAPYASSASPTPASSSSS